MDYKLSILIASLLNRKLLRERLLKTLKLQLSKNIELLIDIDNGEISIGMKRQRMLEKSKGEYIVFIDDDDMVSKDYIKLILKALEKTPDCVGIHLLYYINGELSGKAFHSIQYDHWENVPDLDIPGNYLFYRCPNHLNPVKRELALKVGFPDLRLEEDRQYSKELFNFLKTEEYISQPIYHYYN